jgi:hypothetical protein
VYAQWPVGAFEMSGEISSYDGRGFCRRCGSRLLDTADPGDTLIEIRIGSLEPRALHRWIEVHPEAGPESAKGVPSESRQITQRSPGWTTSPPSAWTRSTAAIRSATGK